MTSSAVLFVVFHSLRVKGRRFQRLLVHFVMGFVEQLAVYIPGDNLTEVRLKDFDDTDNQTKECLLRFHFLLPRA